MSDLRDELEQGFSSVETQSETPNISDNVEEQPVSPETAATDEWMDAPKSYTKEYQDTFKTLSPDWRKYLIEREKQVERGFSEKNNRIESYKWADNAFNSRQERMAKLGFQKAQDYIEHMTAIDDALELNPAETIKALANAYGVNFGETTNSDTEVQRQIATMQQEMQSYRDFIKNQQQMQANNEFNAFINAKDEAGNPKHPYFEEVKADMSNLLAQGRARNFEEAYNAAIWTNEAVRQKLIEESVKQQLNSKVEAAKVAKDAGFSPKSKAQEEVRELSLREELEAQFKEI
jgi:hypothetical protein